MSTHYVTHIKVERVDNAIKADRNARTHEVVKVREVREVGQVTVKAPSLEALAEKVGAHLALFDGEVAE